MNKEMFLSELRRRLRQLPEEEINKRTDYYSEMIADMVEDGMTEEEAIKSFGDIDHLAQEILQETPFGTLVKNRIRPEKGWTTTAVILAVLGSPIWLSLLIAAFAVVITLFAGIWAIAACVAAIVLAIGICGITILIKAFTLGGAYILISLGTGLILTGLCVLGVLLLKLLILFTIRISKGLFHKIKSFFIKRGDRK